MAETDKFSKQGIVDIVIKLRKEKQSINDLSAVDDGALSTITKKINDMNEDNFKGKTGEQIIYSIVGGFDAKLANDADKKKIIEVYGKAIQKYLNSHPFEAEAKPNGQDNIKNLKEQLLKEANEFYNEVKDKDYGTELDIKELIEWIEKEESIDILKIYEKTLKSKKEKYNKTQSNGDQQPKPESTTKNVLNELKNAEAQGAPTNNKGANAQAPSTGSNPQPKKPEPVKAEDGGEDVKVTEVSAKLHDRLGAISNAVNEPKKLKGDFKTNAKNLKNNEEFMNNLDACIKAVNEGKKMAGSIVIENFAEECEEKLGLNQQNQENTKDKATDNKYVKNNLDDQDKERKEAKKKADEERAKREQYEREHNVPDNSVQSVVKRTGYSISISIINEEINSLESKKQDQKVIGKLAYMTAINELRQTRDSILQFYEAYKEIFIAAGISETTASVNKMMQAVNQEPGLAPEQKEKMIEDLMVIGAGGVCAGIGGVGLAHTNGKFLFKAAADVGFTAASFIAASFTLGGLIGVAAGVIKLIYDIKKKKALDHISDKIYENIDKENSKDIDDFKKSKDEAEGMSIHDMVDKLRNNPSYTKVLEGLKDKLNNDLFSEKVDAAIELAKKARENDKTIAQMKIDNEKAVLEGENYVIKNGLDVENIDLNKVDEKNRAAVQAYLNSLKSIDKTAKNNEKDS